MTPSTVLLRSALAVAILSQSCRGEGERGGSPVGEVAYSFKLEAMDHRRFYLNEQRGKPVVLLFWHTSCQICKREMVELEKARTAIGGERIAVATVLADPENVDLARRMVGGLGIGYPTLLDRDGAVCERYRVDEFPTTVVISPGGEIVLHREGYTEPLMGQLKAVVESYL